MLKSASANQPEVSMVGQGLKPSWGLVQGLKSCQCHSRKAGGSPAGTITTTRGSGRNTRAFECKPMSHSLSLTHRERLALFGNLPGQCCLWGGDLKWREGGLRVCFPWWGKLGAPPGQPGFPKEHGLSQTLSSLHTLRPPPLWLPQMTMKIMRTKNKKSAPLHRGGIRSASGRRS